MTEAAAAAVEVNLNARMAATGAAAAATEARLDARMDATEAYLTRRLEERR